MTAAQIKVAFYAPLKSPNDPEPSGDREIARLLMRAMLQTGYDVRLITEVKSYQKRPSLELFEQRKSSLAEERVRIMRLFRVEKGWIPDVWFTYHSYCKSPDWLGSSLSKEFGFSYVTAELARTGQGQATDWIQAREVVRENAHHADINFFLKESDRRYLTELEVNKEKMVSLPPYIDLDQIYETAPSSSVKLPFQNSFPTLITVGMMREGKKTRCYMALTEALKKLGHVDYNLIVVGDGPERSRIEESCSFLPNEQKYFVGTVPREEVFGLMKAADIFVWPGIAEPIGMVYLEAQALGLPVVAYDNEGVPFVVKKDVTGLLTEVHDAQKMADAIDLLLKEPKRRKQMGLQAKEYVAENHAILAAVDIFNKNIGPIVAKQRGNHV